jgi:hypothetical protein
VVEVAKRQNILIKMALSVKTEAAGCKSMPSLDPD